MSSGYFLPLIFLPVVIDTPGKYLTRCGDEVEITKSSTGHDFGCYGTYSDGISERWHKSGRVTAARESKYDVIIKVTQLHDVHDQEVTLDHGR